MRKPSIAKGIVCLVFVAVLLAADEPKKSDKQPVPITKEKLLGKWKGPKDVPITLEFTEKKVKVTVIEKVGEMSKPTVLEWDYEIDAKGEWVNLHPLNRGGLANAKLNTDGTLTGFFVAVPPTIPKELNGIIFTFVKPA
jgi:hypothetical protein